MLSILLLLMTTACQVQNFDDTNRSGPADTTNSTNSSAITHHQGEDCISCHANSQAPLFQSGGTLFDTINAADLNTALARSNYIVRLQNGSDTVNMVQATSKGNFYTTTTLTANDYRAQILDASGTIVNQSPADHGASKMNCNSCHTQNGTNSTNGRIVEGVSYIHDVYSHLSSCINCHGGDGGFTISYSAVSVRVDTTTPSNSLLLQKGSGTVSHSGGALLGTASGYKYRSIYEWIREGALDN